MKNITMRQITMKRIIIKLIVFIMALTGLPAFATSNGVTLEYVRPGRSLAIGTKDTVGALTINGTLALTKLSSIPAASAGYGKIFVNGDNLYYNNGGSLTFLVNNGNVSGVNATTVDGIDSTQFLRSDTSDNFTSGTLTFDAGTSVDINSTAVSIADTDISLDGASTTFTQTTGSINVVPASGTDFTSTIASGGEFKINTTGLVFNGTNSRVGIGFVNPRVKLDVNGTILGVTINGGTANFTGTVTANAFVGSGAGITNLNASNVSSGVLGSTYGGTGINNAGSFTYGANNITFTTAGVTSLTLPTAGTLATLAGTETLRNKTLEAPVINGRALFTNNSIAQFNGSVLIPGGAGVNKVLTSDANGSASWQDVSSLPSGDSATIDGLDSTQFLRSDASDSYTSGTLTFDAGTIVDINSTTVSIADINISLDGASTTFTQTTGAIQMIPASGSTFAVNGSLTLVPSSIALISAGSSIPVANSIVKIAGNGGAVNIDYDPQITDGVHGQIIILRGTSNTNTVTLEELNGLALTDGLSFVLGNKDTMSLMYDAGDDQWIEISRSDK